MGEENKEVDLDRQGLLPIVVVGFKRTREDDILWKALSSFNKKREIKVLLVPADNFRPAAKDQLITLANSLEMDYFDSDLSMTPAKISLAAMDYAKGKDYDVVIIDTAGRLHVDDELMDNLKTFALIWSPLSQKL